MIKKDQRGVILPVLLILMVAFSIIGVSLLSYSTSQFRITNSNVFIANAMQVAEAGVEQSLYQINQDESFTGYSSDQIFIDNATQGRGIYTTSITPTGDTNARILTSTARVYRLSDLANPVSEKKIRVTIVGTNSAGYSVYTGPGGLTLNGSASITNSDIYVNGKLSLNGSARIGTTSQPLNVFVAHQACPAGSNPGPTYPDVCTSGQPISFTGGSSPRIYGTVCATGQTSSSNIFPGSGGSGLQAGCVAPPVTQPTYNRNAHISAVTTTAAANNPTYTCANSDTKTWPPNLRLNGNVSLGGSCTLTIRGNVYITGNLDMNGSLTMRIDNSLGITRPVIMVDGNITNGGSARVLANSSGTGAHFISFKSSAACSPNCADVTGTDLKTSSQLETINIGGSANMPGMIFQSYWGKLTLGGSGNMGAALGQTIDMSGSGTIIFGTLLSSGDRTWSATSYQEIFD